MLMLDLNDGLGLRRIEGGTLEAHQTTSVGSSQPQEEHYAGNLFHLLLCELSLTACTTTHPIGPTFYGTEGSTSTIDHIATSSIICVIIVISINYIFYCALLRLTIICTMLSI